MQKIRGNLDEIAGAVIDGGETERWFLDTERGQLILISATYQTDEQVETSVEMIKSAGEKYLAIPYLTEDEFLYEVKMFARTQREDKPNLETALLKAIENSPSRTQIKAILNREPGKGKEFGNFLHRRLKERMQAWIESLGYELEEV